MLFPSASVSFPSERYLGDTSGSVEGVSVSEPADCDRERVSTYCIPGIQSPGTAVRLGPIAFKYSGLFIANHSISKPGLSIDPLVIIG